ncbi:hypothetical protein EAMG_03894 [Escherichia coli M056]|uniref:hypothetical protein n=1 Tax=Escherichia coli TaxID=562 RepID=UPI000A183CCE|nr:hypothetical protein [Escherichia coli]OSK22855.1 hypothetical protein EAMG_03894 [Escherichia coli M056]
MKNKASVFIRFIDFRGELLIRVSAVDGIAPLEKDKATYILLSGNRISVELPFEQVDAALQQAENIINQMATSSYTEIICRDKEC